MPDLDSPGPLRGDASDSFALSQFFPEPARPAVEAAGDLLSRLGLAPKTPVVVAAGSNANNANSGGGQRAGGRAENERRRALALKELDLRLQAATAATAARAATAGRTGEASEVVRQPEVGGEVMKAPEGEQA